MGVGPQRISSHKADFPQICPPALPSEAAPPLPQRRNPMEDGDVVSQHVMVVTPMGTTLTLACQGGGIEIRHLKELIAQRGFSSALQKLHVRHKDVAKVDELIAAGTTLHLSLPAVVSFHRPPARNKRQVKKAAKPPFHVAGPSAGGSLLEALVTHQRLRAVANERGLNPEGLISACATVRRFMLQRRATRTCAPLLLQAAIRRTVHWRAWRDGRAARRTQAAIRGKIAMASWAPERAAARLKVFVRGALQRYKYLKQAASRRLDAAVLRCLMSARHSKQIEAGSVLSQVAHGSLERAGYIRWRKEVRDEAVRKIQGLMRAHPIRSRAAVATSSCTVMQRMSRGAVASRRHRMERECAIALEAAMRRAVVPTARSLTSTVDAFNKVRELRVQWREKHSAVDDALRELVGDECMGRGIDELIKAVGNVADGLEELDEKKGLLKAKLDGVRHAVRGGGDGWKEAAAERDAARSECIDVAERLLLIYPASAPAIEAARKSEENVVAAMEHGHMHDLGRNVDLESFVADGSIVTSSEWRAMLDDAVHASAKWTSYNRDRCDALAAATEDAVEKMLEKLFSGLLLSSERGRVRVTSEEERRWLCETWWENCQESCEAVVRARLVFLRQVGRLSSKAKEHDKLRAMVEEELEGWRDAEKSPHVRINQEISKITEEMEEIEDDDRYDTAELRKKKLEKKQKKGTLAPEEEEELRGVAELIAEREMQLSLLRKKQRGVFSSMAEVCQKHFPEVPVLFPDNDLIGKLFQVGDNDAARLYVPERALEHYNTLSTLSATPESRHNVYEAELGGQVCALKEYNVTDPSNIKKLQNELKILSSLDHPCILQVQCFFQETARAYVELPLCNKGNFGAWLAGNRREHDIIASLHQVLRAVEWLHDKEIVHCDVRKENVLVHEEEDKTLKTYLSDFDVSDSQAKSTMRATATGMGARGYNSQLTMAPEVRAGQHCSKASDMFSFGGLMFFAMFRDHCLSHGDEELPVDGQGMLIVPADCDAEKRDLLVGLLQVPKDGRFTASKAMNHSFFRSFGAKVVKALDEEQARRAELERETAEEARRREMERRDEEERREAERLARIHECLVCGDELDRDQLLHCPTNHRICKECVSGLVRVQASPENQKRFTDVGYKIFCCFCEYGERRLVFFGEGTQVDALAPFLEKDALEQLLKARQDLEVASALREKEEEYELRLKALEEENALMHNMETAVRRHRKSIIEEILELRCPRCKLVFYDFNDCFALTCDGCGCGFCAYCLKDCGQDAHRHVAQCDMNRAPGRDVYGTQDLFLAHHRERKRGKLIEYFRDKVEDPRTKAMLFDELSKGGDIADLGLTAEMLGFSR